MSLEYCNVVHKVSLQSHVYNKMFVIPKMMVVMFSCESFSNTDFSWLVDKFDMYSNVYVTPLKFATFFLFLVCIS